MTPGILETETTIEFMKMTSKPLQLYVNADKSHTVYC